MTGMLSPLFCFSRNVGQFKLATLGRSQSWSDGIFSWRKITPSESLLDRSTSKIRSWKPLKTIRSAAAVSEVAGVVDVGLNPSSIEVGRDDGRFDADFLRSEHRRNGKRRSGRRLPKGDARPGLPNIINSELIRLQDRRTFGRQI